MVIEPLLVQRAYLGSFVVSNTLPEFPFSVSNVLLILLFADRVV